MPRIGLLLLLLLPLSSSFSAEDKDRLVRTTEPRTPEEERTGFHLPEGFSIQLFADESQLGGKTPNMAFDARGRLWVSSTREYPYAVPKIRWSPDTTHAKDSRDTIRILEDTDGDGHADKVTVFADELNIPTGVLPYKNGCIAWSIPNILYLEDTDGDGKCDKRTILFGPLGYERDTHGMISSLRLGLDGWVYATHGFSNTSHFEVRPENRRKNDESRMTNDENKNLPVAPEKLQDSSFVIRHSDLGQSLDITSGSVFRFKPDGSRVEPWTSGQVNPFGLCWDSWGNLYSADCHSNPISQLIRGACYPSFGKPDDGLGFAPVMCAHAHGSTGLCGIIYLDGGVWGPEWNDHMFVGNCVTSRVNHDHVTFIGSTPKANEAPDFLTSDDPWFRPVDLQLGPDSALYVADYYNRIIGHYEVPLDHPGRDKDHGRIWRVVREGYTGKLTACDLSKSDAPKLMTELASSNLTRRYLATEQLVSRIGRPALRVAREMLSNQPESDDAPVISDYKKLVGKEEQLGIADSHALWVAARLGDAAIAYRVGRNLITGGPALQGEDERLCVTSINIIGEKDRFDDEDEETMCDAEFDARGVRSMRAGGLAMVRHASHVTSPGCLFRGYVGPESGVVTDPQPIPDVDLTTPICESGDASLIAVWKMAVRAILSQPGFFEFLDRGVEDPKRRDEMADVAATVPTAEAATWLLNYVNKAGPSVHNLPAKVSHVARYLSPDRDAELVSLARQHFGNDLDTQLDLFSAIREGRKAQNLHASQPLATWSTELTERLLTALKSEPANIWRPVTPPTDANPNPWLPATRKCVGGQERAFLDSHVAPGSEKFTGTLRSAPFALPEKLTFWLAGHRGFPTAEPHDKNFVHLVEVDTGNELARAYPPRNDVAHQITWDFTGPDHASRISHQVFLELTDGDNATAYAWLAAGGFDPAVVTIPNDALQRDKRIRMFAQLCGTGSLPVAPEMNHGQAARDTHRLAADATAFLISLPDKAGLAPDTRAALADFLAARSSDSAALLLAPLSRDAELAPVVFAALRDPKATSDELANAFRTQPFRAQAKLAAALAGSVSGANQLLKLAAPAVLAEPLVSSKLNALDDAKISQRLKALTASLPPHNEALNKFIAQRLHNFAATKADATRGEQVFTTVCFICHRIGVRGNLVGPQLDGIGARGIERLLEDILDPNRSVDPAFRLHLVKRKDGTLYAGLQRREEGDALVFADATAQETRIPKSEIAGNEESAFSLMPPGLGEVLTEQQLDDLLAYLLARK